MPVTCFPRWIILSYSDGSGPVPAPARGPFFWKARSLTSEEGPKPRVGSSLTFRDGPENLSILFSKF